MAQTSAAFRALGEEVIAYGAKAATAAEDAKHGGNCPHLLVG